MTLKRVNAGRGHSYRLDGKPVQGVTTLIGKGVPKPALPNWAARSVAEYVADADPGDLDALRRLGRDGMIKALKDVPWRDRDAAAGRGTEIHAIAERLSRGEEVRRTDAIEPIWGYVEACVRFLDEWRISVVLTETVIGSRRHRYAGTLDLIADLPDGRRALFDYKTSRSGVWGETALQLAAYRHADFYLDGDGHEQPMSELQIGTAYAVHLRPDGYSVHPIDTSNEVFDMFRCAAYIARRADDVMRSWVGEPEEWVAA